MRTCWRDLIISHMESVGDSWSNVESIAIIGSLDAAFDNGYGSAEGEPFTLWTKSRVYFPTEYDGAEGVASVPRNPCEECVDHV